MNEDQTTHLDKIEDSVHNHYSNVAKTIINNNSTNCCGEPIPVGQDRIPSLGIDKNLLARSQPRSGETVVDFGSGPGHDLLEVAQLIGPHGHAIGVDFSVDMIVLAKSNVEKLGLKNVEFVKSKLTSISLPDNLADLVTSNCVFNLVSDRQKAFNEAYRILKPGGRLVISDQITHIDEGTDLDIETKCGCLGGATSIEEYIEMMKNTGFDEVNHEVEFSNSAEVAGQHIKYSSVLFFAKKPRR